jgi:hypothetical protein
MNRNWFLLLLAALPLVLSACIFGHGDPVPSHLRPKGVLVIATAVIGDGPGVSIDDAVARGGRDPVLVNGGLFVDPPGGIVRLCDEVLASGPEQCVGSWLEVRGLDLSTVTGLQTAGDVRWATSMQLFGRIQ